MLNPDLVARGERAGSHSSDETKGAIRVQTEFSRGFGDWLIANRVGLVCSTYQTGHLLFVGVRADGTPVPSAASFFPRHGTCRLFATHLRRHQE